MTGRISRPAPVSNESQARIRVYEPIKTAYRHETVFRGMNDEAIFCTGAYERRCYQVRTASATPFFPTRLRSTAAMHNASVWLCHSTVKDGKGRE